MIKDWGKH